MKKNKKGFVIKKKPENPEMVTVKVKPGKKFGMKSREKTEKSGIFKVPKRSYLAFKDTLKLVKEEPKKEEKELTDEEKFLDMSVAKIKESEIEFDIDKLIELEKSGQNRATLLKYFEEKKGE